VPDAVLRHHSVDYISSAGHQLDQASQIRIGEQIEPLFSRMIAPAFDARSVGLFGMIEPG